MKRYHSLDYIFTLEIEEALSLIEYALAQTEEELLFQRWVCGPQFQMSFDKFKTMLKPQETKSGNEILSEVQDIMKLFDLEGGG